MNPSFVRMFAPLQSSLRSHDSNGDKIKAIWIDKDLKEAIEALKFGYNMKNVC